MTPRWGGAVRKTAKMLESNEWAVFEHCDADFSGTISTAELKARFVEVLGKAGTSLSDAELDAFFEAVDADRDGFVDYDEWQTMVELVKKRAAGDVNAKVLGNPRGTLKVLRPGSIARDAAAMDSEKMCKLKTGTLLVRRSSSTATSRAGSGASTRSASGPPFCATTAPTLRRTSTSTASCA